MNTQKLSVPSAQHVAHRTTRRPPPPVPVQVLDWRPALGDLLLPFEQEMISFRQNHKNDQEVSLWSEQDDDEEEDDYVEGSSLSSLSLSGSHDMDVDMNMDQHMEMEMDAYREQQDVNNSDWTPSSASEDAPIILRSPLYMSQTGMPYFPSILDRGQSITRCPNFVIVIKKERHGLPYAFLKY